LKNLKEILNSSELQNVRFTNKNKEEVYRQIRNKKKKQSIRNDWLPKGLSVVMMTGFIFASIVFTNNYVLKNEVSDNSPGKEAAYTESKVLTKEEIQLLMINSQENFRTAKGQFTYESNVFKETVEYQISNINGKTKSYVSTKLDSLNEDHNDEANKEGNRTLIFNGEEVLDLNNTSKNYTLQQADLSYKRNKKISLKGEINQTEDGLPLYKTPTFVGDASISIYPYEMASKILRNYGKWKIEKQNSDLLDKKAIIISGILEEENSTKYNNASSFTFWIEKQTGILLKMELYSSDSIVISSLETTELELNNAVDNNKFTINIPEGYTLKSDY
jgi:hypothetical protein